MTLNCFAILGLSKRFRNIVNRVMFSGFFTRKEAAILTLFLCVELVLFFIANVEDVEQDEAHSLRVDNEFVFSGHVPEPGEPCWMFHTSNLLGEWVKPGEVFKPRGFTKGPTYGPFPLGNGTEFIPGTTVVVRRWDVYNPYQMMHAMFNFYVITKHLRLDRPVVIFKDRWSGGSTGDIVLWKALSRHILTEDLNKYRFENAVFIDYPSKCFINAIPESPATKGSCPVDLYKDFTYDVAESFNATYYDYPKIRILWSSRQPYWRNGGMRDVYRMVTDEEKFLSALGDALGDKYQVSAYDFGNFTHDESIRRATQADLMVGVHGAGLQWSAWMPPGAPLVEIFGGNRGPSNVSYRHISKAVQRPYRYCNWGAKLQWSRGANLDCVVNAIKSFF